MDSDVQRSILITRGATGIGQATHLLAAQKGDAVAIDFALSDQVPSDLVSQIEAMDQVAIALKTDFAKEEEVVRIFEKMDCELGRSLPWLTRQPIWTSGCDLMRWAPTPDPHLISKTPAPGVPKT